MVVPQILTVYFDELLFWQNAFHPINLFAFSIIFVSLSSY